MVKEGKQGNHTLTGKFFEEKVQCHRNGIDLTKHNLYKFLKSRNINYKDIISKKLLPDEAYLHENGHLEIIEKKFQQVAGSVDEKIQTCGFKILQYQKIGKAIGASKVTYTYYLSSWFKKPEYKDVLEYIRSVPGCDYVIIEGD